MPRENRARRGVDAAFRGADASLCGSGASRRCERRSLPTNAGFLTGRTVVDSALDDDEAPGGAASVVAVVGLAHANPILERCAERGLLSSRERGGIDQEVARAIAERERAAALEPLAWEEYDRQNRKREPGGRPGECADRRASGPRSSKAAEVNFSCAADSRAVYAAGATPPERARRRACRGRARRRPRRGTSPRAPRS